MDDEIVEDGSYLKGDNKVFRGLSSYLLIILIFDKFDESWCELLLILFIAIVAG